MRNVGDESVGSVGDLGDVKSVEVAWEFPSRQSNVTRFAFPEELPQGEQYTFPCVEHKVLSAGYAFMHLRLFRVGGSPKLTVRDAAGNRVPTEEGGKWHRISGVGTFYVSPLGRELASFRAQSRAEVLGKILLVVAIAALVVNTVVAAYSILR